MSWLQPIQIQIKKRSPSKGVLPGPAKSVVIEGTRYPSMTAARKALNCSYSKIYRMIGENWRWIK